MRFVAPLISVLLSMSAHASAQLAREVPASMPRAAIGRQEAMRRAARHAPEVAVARAPLGSAAEALSAATPFLRAPTLSAFAGVRTRSVVQGPELSVSIVQDVAFRALGAARREAASQLQVAVREDQSRARLAGSLRGLLGWVQALEAKEVLRFRTDTLAQAEAIAASTSSRVRSGVGQPRELALAEGDVGTAQAQVFDAEGELVEALIELGHVLAIAPYQRIDVTGDLYASSEAVPDPARVLGATDQHPALRTAHARTGLAEREVTLARAQLGPYASVGGSYSRESTGEQIVGALVGVPLMVVDPSRYEQARLRAQADTYRAEAARLGVELRRDVRLTLHDREHWREVREALRVRALGPLREALRLAKKEYEIGTQDVSMVLLARQRLSAAEEQMARASGALLRADAYLGYLTGSLSVDDRGDE